MKRFVKPISIVLALVCLTVIPISAYAETGTSVSSYISSLFTKWKGYGILDKSYKSFDINKPIQRIDFITFINSILKTSKLADVGFTDVPKDSWYGKEVAKAVASGYVDNADNVKFYPFDNITRLDAAVMAARVFALKLGDKKLLNKIADAKSIDEDDLNSLCAVIEKGGLSEVAAGRYAPFGVLKLQDALVMLDKCVGQPVIKAGTITTNVSGDMLISTGNVTLRGITISGNLVIGEGVGDGTVTMDNVNLKGKLLIRGGGTTGITVKNSKIGGDLTVEKSSGNVHVDLVGNTTVEQTYLKSGCSLNEIYLFNGGEGFVNVEVDHAAFDNQTAELQGDYEKINVGDSNLNVELNGNSKEVDVSKEAEGGFTLGSGAIDTLSSEASKNTLDFLGGKVSTLNIVEGAKGNKVTVDGTANILAANIRSTTEVNFLKGKIDKLYLDPDSKGSYLTVSDGAFINIFVANAAADIKGYGKIDSAYVYASNVNMYIKPSSVYIGAGITSNISGVVVDPNLSSVIISGPTEMTIQEGKTQSLNPQPYPPNSSLAYISSDNKIATVSDKGEVTGVSAGTTYIHITGACTNFNTTVKDIKVTVTPGNITDPGYLDVSPDNAEAGTTRNVVITYTAADNFINGTIVLRLPEGFPALETDTVIIGNNAEVPLSLGQRLNIRTLTFTNLYLTAGQKIIVKLNSKTIPDGGEYIFNAVADGDGTGPKLPTSGEQEKATFTSDKLKTLVAGTNYVLTAYDSASGTIKFSKLSFAGFIGATKWLVKAQNDKFTVPDYDDVVTGNEYKLGDTISITEDQHLMLAAVDADNKVKAFADITLKSGWQSP
ncbi:MAG TPA: BslA/BslB family hydrophobin [Ruminiclostridium sp.]|nr:BslA/BslB family hydrophobin [Ruminiclostridium sp.]